nr:immunoglobulin light chain junction region [Macaca mulatta]MOX45330.1 immunoglobulin light chain junction region [Macaca mulatta]
DYSCHSTDTSGNHFF